MNISEEKSRLRKEIKQKRLKMTESDVQIKSNIICNKIINSQFYKESNSKWGWFKFSYKGCTIDR